MHDDSWKHRLVHALRPGPHGKADVATATALKEANKPASLFHYRPWNNYTRDALTRGYEWLSGADAYNDPYDSALSSRTHDLLMEKLLADGTTLARLGVLPNEIEEARRSSEPLADVVRELMHRCLLRDGRDPKEARTHADGLQHATRLVADRMRLDHMELSRRAVRVCSLCEVHDSMLMWGHYADKHQGICIEYPVGPYDEGGLDFYLSLWPVAYSDEAPDGTDLHRAAIDKGAVDSERATFTAIHAALVKSREWGYEREWRIATVAGLPASKLAANAGQEFPMPRPWRVIVGSRMLPAHREEVIKIAEARKIPVHESCLVPGTFKLEERLIWPKVTLV